MLPKPTPTLDLVTDAPRATPPPLVMGADGRDRCGWVRTNDVMTAYHDDEWGVPLHGDVPLFEKLSLEGFQSGLSWLVVLRKRDAFRRAFDGFEPATVGAYGEADIERLLADASIIRNRQKIEAVIGNAGALARLLDADGPGALDRMVWASAPELRAESDRPVEATDVPAKTAESLALSKALKRVGFRFVGPITAYALMQSAGIVDDHLAGCWRAGTTGS